MDRQEWVDGSEQGRCINADGEGSGVSRLRTFSNRVVDPRKYLDFLNVIKIA